MDIDVYLFFDGTCEEAFAHYAKVLGGTTAMLMRYGDAPDAPASYKGSRRVLHTSLNVGTRCLMGSDAPPPGADGSEHGYEAPRSFRVSLGLPTPAEAERIFAGLAEGGRIEAPLSETFFSQSFGMLTDRFAIPWMINCAKEQGQSSAGTSTAGKAPARKRNKS